MLERFLINIEVIFLIKKQTRLKEKEQNGRLTNSEKKLLKKIDKYLQNLKMI